MGTNSRTSPKLSIFGMRALRVSAVNLKFALPTLGYPVEKGIPPTITGEQLDYHYNKHHKAYVDKLNELTEGTALADKTVMDVIVASWKDRANKQVLFNQAAQHFNHSFYWASMKPNGSAMPSALEKEIADNFGSVDAFKKAFEAKGLANFGSGWTWLVRDGSKLDIVNTGNAELPGFSTATDGKKLTPILTCDVWEHAYYVDFRNRRAEYLTVRLSACIYTILVLSTWCTSAHSITDPRLWQSYVPQLATPYSSCVLYPATPQCHSRSSGRWSIGRLSPSASKRSTTPFHLCRLARNTRLVCSP